MKKTTLFQILLVAFLLQFLFVTGACMTISRPKLKMRYVLLWPAIPEYISRKSEAFFQYLYNRLRRRLHFQMHIRFPFIYDLLAKFTTASFFATFEKNNY